MVWDSIVIVIEVIRRLLIRHRAKVQFKRTLTLVNFCITGRSFFRLGTRLEHFSRVLNFFEKNKDC